MVKHLNGLVPILAGVHQGSIVGPLFFNSYKQCNKRPLLNNKTPFSVVKNTNSYADMLSKNSQKIS